MLATVSDQEPLQSSRPNYHHSGDMTSCGTSRPSNTSNGASAVEVVRRYIESLPQQVPFRKEVKSGQFWRAVWTEFIVTLLFLVIGCGAGVRWSYTSISSNLENPGQEDSPGATSLIEDLKASLALGLTVAALVQSVAHISGCHLNPAVSITMLVTRSISPLKTVSYVLAQCLGAIVGAAILYGLTPVGIRNVGLSATCLHPNVHPSQAFGVEFLITLLVIITLSATYESMQHNESPCFKGLAVGVAYTVGHLFGYRYTGASMNPARSLALAIVTNTWTNHWVYWVGPIFGGIIGGITYEYIRDSGDSDSCQVIQQPQRSCRRSQLYHENTHNREMMNREIKRDQSGLSSHDTELTVTSNDYRV